MSKWDEQDEIMRDIQAILLKVKDSRYKMYHITLMSRDGTIYSVSNRRGK